MSNEPDGRAPLERQVRRSGAIIRMCECGTGAWTPSPCLDIYTDGVINFANCEFCGKTWDTDRLKELLPNAPAVSARPRQDGNEAGKP